SFVDHGEVGGFLVRGETDGELAGPAAVGIDGGGSAVGDGIAEGDDGRGFRGSEDVHAVDPIPELAGGGIVDGGGTGEIAGLRDVSGVQAGEVDGGNGFDRNVEADHEFAEGGDFEIERI